MQSQFYFLSPVEAVKVTDKNLEEVATWCGGKVIEIESRRKPGTMEKYVWVPTPSEQSMSDASPGTYVTKRMTITAAGELRIAWAVFRNSYFVKNYFDTPNEAVDATWERAAKERMDKVLDKHFNSEAEKAAFVRAAVEKMEAEVREAAGVDELDEEDSPEETPVEDEAS